MCSKPSKMLQVQAIGIIPSTCLLLLMLNVITCKCSPTSEGTIHEHYESHNQKDSTFSGFDRCQNIYQNLTQERRARFVDASGKPGSGIYGGNTLWYGSYSECKKLSESRYCWTMFPGNVSLVKNKTETKHFEWGVCIPNGCTSKDVTKNFEFLFKTVSDISEVTPSVKRLVVVCAKEPEYTTSTIITIVFCGILVGICLLASLVEIYAASYKPHKATKTENDGDISMDNEKTPLIHYETTKLVNERGSVHEILYSFSMIRNIKSIMNTNVGKNDLTYLHGIRVLSLFWILIIHVNSNTVLNFWPYDNLNDVIRYERKVLTMVLESAHAVDTFFVLGGLLTMYTNLCKKRKNDGETNWFKYYFHRFWRLTPTMMFIILFIANLRPFFGAGPLWFLESDTSACSDNWWTNLLYLNNFIHIKKMCIGHTWYLSVDMQFFIISPIFLLIAYRYGLRPLVCVVGVVILASIIVTASIVAQTESSLPLVLGFRRLNTFFSNDLAETFQQFKQADVMDNVYFKPWSRIPPYVMGLVLGYVIYKHFSKDFKLPWVFVGMMWISSTALALTDIYAPHSGIKNDPHEWTTGEEAVFWSLKYPIWGLCIVWLIFACHYNYAGLIKNILEAKFWIPLSHINYVAYIIHWDVLLVLIYNIESPLHYTAFTTVTYFLSSLVLTYVFAFIITAVVELPFANLEALAWKKWERK